MMLSVILLILARIAEILVECYGSNVHGDDDGGWTSVW